MRYKCRFLLYLWLIHVRQKDLDYFSEIVHKTAGALINIVRYIANFNHPCGSIVTHLRELVTVNCGRIHYEREPFLLQNRQALFIIRTRGHNQTLADLTACLDKQLLEIGRLTVEELVGDYQRAYAINHRHLGKRIGFW